VSDGLMMSVLSVSVKSMDFQYFVFWISISKMKTVNIGGSASVQVGIEGCVVIYRYIL
jgi:hypothetical protein